jgi:hypothetical protein
VTTVLFVVFVVVKESQVKEEAKHGEEAREG